MGVADRRGVEVFAEQISNQGSAAAFFARTSSLEFSATGSVWPMPFALRRDASTPCAVSHATTDRARFSESAVDAWLSLSLKEVPQGEQRRS